MLRAASLLVVFWLGGCDGCDGVPPRHDTARCGACVRAADCQPGLTCLNGVCETAPPSCHVQIGL